MLPEIGELRIDEGRSRRRDEHLPAVPCGRDAGNAVDVMADVALFANEGRTRVDADSHANGTRDGETLGEFGSGSEGARCSGKRKEKGVSLRVHLHAAVYGTCLPDDRSVIRKCLRVPLRAELVQQLRRTLDIREDERDGAGRKLGSHTGIIRGSGLASKVRA